VDAFRLKLDVAGLLVLIVEVEHDDVALQMMRKLYHIVQGTRCRALDGCLQHLRTFLLAPVLARGGALLLHGVVVLLQIFDHSCWSTRHSVFHRGIVIFLGFLPLLVGFSDRDSPIKAELVVRVVNPDNTTFLAKRVLAKWVDSIANPSSCRLYGLLRL